MSQAIYRPRSENFRFFDMTKNAPAREMTLEETQAHIRKVVNEEVEKSFNNMDTALSELRRIARFEGRMKARAKGGL